MSDPRATKGGLNASPLARLAKPRAEDPNREQVRTTLARFLQPKRLPAPGETCELCAEPISEDDHQHLVDIDTRSLACVDRPCYLLFAVEGKTGQRYRAVPQEVRYDPNFRLEDVHWEALQIPVGTAFFFHNSKMERTVAFYPSPAGATESELPLPVWEEITAANPLLRGMVDDVEALLIRRDREKATEAYVVPIDICYELTGIIRRDWRGFDGGEEARASIGAFFDGLRERARVVSASA